MLHDVFISYSTKDIESAEKVRQILEQNRIACWMAPEDIPSGSNYAKEIPQAIRACRIFLLILSDNAQKSNWVVKELDNAVNCGKIIMPLMLEDCPLNDEFNFLLTGTQRYTSYRKSEETLSMLVKQIQAIIGVKEEEINSDQEEETEEKHRVTLQTAHEKKTKTKKKKVRKAKTEKKDQTAPIVRKAKPVKVRPKKIRAPFTFGKVEALALLAIPGMALVSFLGYMWGNCRYFHWRYIFLYSGDKENLIFYVISSALMGVLMWLEWVRFHHREKMENPEVPCCPACEDNHVKQGVFLTRRMTFKEYLPLLLVPVCAFLGSICQSVVRVLHFTIMHKRHYTALEILTMPYVGMLQGVAIGLVLANLLVRYMRRRSGLCSTVYRCRQCRAKFLPVRNKK